jgi:hypothetical protein
LLPFSFFLWQWLIECDDQKIIDKNTNNIDIFFKLKNLILKISLISFIYDILSSADIKILWFFSFHVMKFLIIILAWSLNVIFLILIFEISYSYLVSYLNWYFFIGHLIFTDN